MKLMKLQFSMSKALLTNIILRHKEPERLRKQDQSSRIAKLARLDQIPHNGLNISIQEQQSDRRAYWYAVLSDIKEISTRWDLKASTASGRRYVMRTPGSMTILVKPS